MHARQADQTSLFAPVDAAAAFANLYQRWFDDPRGLARANRRQARCAVGSYAVSYTHLISARKSSPLLAER